MSESLKLPRSPGDYERLLTSLRKLRTMDPRRLAIIRGLCRNDLYFLLRYVLGRKDVGHPWLFARCREVQADPDGRIDLWARDHYKSTIITYGLTIMDILASHGEDPAPKWGGIEPTFAIFSHTRPIAKQFLRQIKTEFESNENLKAWFPDVLYEKPAKQSSKWAEDDGIVVKRKSNPKESTVEAWGLVDGQPTSKHFSVLIYDDVVTVESVNTPEMIAKTTARWEMSLNLASKAARVRYIGTRYHFADTYRSVMDRSAAAPRLHPATEDGTAEGDPVFMTRTLLDSKRRTMGEYVFACQMLQNPKADETQGFKRDWLKYYQSAQDGKGMNVYILVDPASGKKIRNDYTAMFAVGLAGDKNYYVLEMIRDRLSLTQRADLLFQLHRKWTPLKVGYEKYGLQADVEHVKDRMERENYRFPIVELGGSLSKPDRIRRLIPLFENGRIYLPLTQHRTIHDGRTLDMVAVFTEEEYTAFPVGQHDDMMDALARITGDTLGAVFPGKKPVSLHTHAPIHAGPGGWMS